MPRTAIEKVLARASGLPAVQPNDIVYPTPDLIMIHDGVVREVKTQLDKIGIKTLAHPEKVMMVSDHDVLYGSQRAADRGAQNRHAAKEWKVGQFFDAGRGGHGHIFPMEQGRVLPGMFYFDNDTHATNAGAVGAFGLRLGNEIGRALATGTTWVRVPSTIRIELRGKLKKGVMARDIGFYLAGQVRAGKLQADFDYRIIEYAGDLDQFSLGERVALCSSPTEMRAAGIFIPPNDAILRYCNAHAQQPFQAVYSDPDATYESEHVIELEHISPQVALPGNLGNAVDIEHTQGTAFSHAFIGSCGSGMYEDLLCAASFLKGKRIADEVRLFIVPGSEASTHRMVADGLAQIFLEAGAIILPAGCGPCNDAVVGPIASGEVSLSTATNNNAGRFGPKDGHIYLGSPATVAASVITGKITDPRHIIADPHLTQRMETAYA
jgi:3-isopropylmalate/(R)-2-methylmalate dehydratase large subunit